MFEIDGNYSMMELYGIKVPSWSQSFNVSSESFQAELFVVTGFWSAVWNTWPLGIGDYV